MKEWDSFINDSTKQYGSSGLPTGGGDSKEKNTGKSYYNPHAGAPTSYASAYKNASPYMKQLAAKWDQQMTPIAPA